jgi:pimeloyl-ACP methyl ester carboxylesterase
MPTATSLEVNGMRFEAFVDGPEGGELVLMLHGFPQFADMWLPLMHEVAGAGFRAAAVTQRGYSPGARPEEVEEYRIEKLVGDVAGFADALGGGRFHLVGHDWGAFVAWTFAAQFPERVRSLTALSTPHPDAFAKALENDAGQKIRSSYIALFRAPLKAAEKLFEASEYALLRRTYQGKVPEPQVNRNVTRLAEPGALTAALNWYRALKPGQMVGKVNVPTLYVWGSEDIALGKTAAFNTGNYVDARYRFEELQGRSHWLVEEVPEEIARMVLEHLGAGSSQPSLRPNED